MANRLLQLLAALTLVLVMAGCGPSNRFNVMERSTGRAPIPLKAVVVGFEDKRGYERKSNSTWLWVPLMPFTSYRYDRYDELLKGAEPFEIAQARRLSERMATARIFESVDFKPTRAEITPGEYDVVISGTLRQVSARGGMTKYGLSLLGDFIHYTGLPYYSRYWDIDGDFYAENAYTGEKLGTPFTIKHTTSRAFYNYYANATKMNDIREKDIFVWDAYIDNFWSVQPASNDESWAKIRDDGQKMLASAARDAEMARKGSPPTFSFLSPPKGERVRGTEVNLRWSLTAPGGLKNVILTVNNTPVNIGVNPIDLANDASSPRSLPASEVSVPLKLGANRFDALVQDHRGNDTRASYELFRMPTALFPEQRAALLIGADSAEASASVDALASALTNPMVGQFESSRVTTLKSGSLNPTELDAALQRFGSPILSGQLAFVYVAAKGDAAGLTLAGGQLKLQDLVSSVRRSLATEEVVLVLDIDWSGSGSGTISSRLRDVPARWAVVTATETAGATKTSGGRTLLADALVRSLEGKLSQRPTLSLEALLDEAFGYVEKQAGGSQSPAVNGRYNPSTTMVERQ